MHEMVDDPVAREMVGYLLVRGGVHIVAYAKALEKLTGANEKPQLSAPFGPDIDQEMFAATASRLFGTKRK